MPVESADDDLEALYRRYATHTFDRSPLPLGTRNGGPNTPASTGTSSPTANTPPATQSPKKPFIATTPANRTLSHLATSSDDTFQQPILGVYALDRELFLYLRSHAGQLETQRAFEEAERRRAACRSYTKRVYLQENPPHDRA